LDDRERLIKQCQRVTYQPRQSLYPQDGAITHVYFPLSGIVSLVLTSGGSGPSVEVAIVGSEGMVGTSAFHGTWKSPAEAVWQVGGEAIRMAADVFHNEMEMTQGRLRSLLGRYTEALTRQTLQSILCNKFHTVDQRLCRWLLMTQDRLGSDALPLTQDTLAAMLAIRRPSVTVAAGALQSAGVISYRRGTITVLDRAALETKSCACYEVVRRQFARLLLAESHQSTKPVAASTSSSEQAA
jgi:CRP-like cAMP-binding protein